MYLFWGASVGVRVSWVFLQSKTDLEENWSGKHPDKALFLASRWCSLLVSSYMGIILVDGKALF